MNGAILQAEGDDAPALPILHDQVQGKVLDEVVAVVPARNETLSTMLSNK